MLLLGVDGPHSEVPFPIFASSAESEVTQCRMRGGAPDAPLLLINQQNRNVMSRIETCERPNEDVFQSLDPLP